jgi:hypothetical protein
LFDRTTGPLNPPDPVDVVAGVSLLVHILGIAISILMVAVLVLIVNVALRALNTAWIIMISVSVPHLVTVMVAAVVSIAISAFSEVAPLVTTSAWMKPTATSIDVVITTCNNTINNCKSNEFTQNENQTNKDNHWPTRLYKLR